MGMVLLQAPLAAVELVEAAVGCSGRRLAGFFGPLPQVAAARQAAGARGLEVLKDAAEDLLALELAASAGDLFVREAGVPLACCLFQATLPPMVQVGNPRTPEDLRGRGYARAIVAGALQLAWAGRAPRRAIHRPGEPGRPGGLPLPGLRTGGGDCRLTVFGG